MTAGLQFAWLQLIKRKSHLAAATAGVTFSVTLLLCQIGLCDSLLESSVSLYRQFKADLVIASGQYQCQPKAAHISARRIAQARAVAGVLSATPVQLAWGALKNPINFKVRQAFLVGVTPDEEELLLNGQTTPLRALNEPDTFLFDASSRAMFGPLGEMYRERGPVGVEIWGRNGRIVGLFDLGPGFTSDGHLITSDETFRKFTAGVASPHPALGLVRLKAGADVETVKRALQGAMPGDVNVYDFEEFLDVERNFWLESTPIGFSFVLGIILGMVVGSVVVYQILHTDVSNHLWEYATMKAMGYRDRQLYRVVLLQSMLMSMLGFVPGCLITHLLFEVTQYYTRLPIYLVPERLALVYGLTLLMCCLSGGLAMRKLRTADPAEIF